MKSLKGSSFSLNVKKTGDILKNSASKQITEYKQRFQSIKDLFDKLLTELIITDFNLNEAYETAMNLFGSSKMKFAAVDGTEYTRPMFDLVIFFSDACAVRGHIEFKENEPPKIEYFTGLIEREKGVCSCIPVYVNKVPEIDQTMLDFREEIQTSVVKPLTDESIAVNSSIASWMMAFAEIYLGYKLVTDPEENIRILLLDRSLTCMQTSLMFDTAYKSKWEKKGALVGYEIDGVPISINELAFGRHYILNEELKIPSARGDYLRYAIIYLLGRKESSLSFDEICEELGIVGRKRRKRVLRFIKKSIKEGFLEDKNDRYSLDPRYENSWPRLNKLVKSLGEQLFERSDLENPLKIRKKDREHWLTTLDIAFLTLFCLYMLIEECWKKKVLLIGITKDTTSRDLKNQLIPVSVNNNLWNPIDQEKLGQVPNTDRMFLQSISLFNYDKLTVPWSLVEYDSAFRTIVPDYEKRIGFVSGAIKNKIIPERLFVKSYIQLSQADYDPQLRSNVLFIDRLVYPEFDVKEESIISFKHDYHEAIEPVNLVFFRNNKVENKMQNLVMTTLKTMTSPSIPEVFGHNKPLFIADKVAKWHYNEARKVIDSAKGWIINNRNLRKFVFYMSTFRERRSEIEATRREI